MKKIYFLFFLVLFSNLYFPQADRGLTEKEITEKLNFLNKKIANDKENSNVLGDLVQQITDYNILANYDKALWLANQIEGFAKNKKDYPRLAEIYCSKSEIYNNLGFQAETKLSLKLASEVIAKIQDPDKKYARYYLLHNSYAQYYEEEEKQDSVNYYAKEAIHSLEHISDSNKKYEQFKHSSLMNAYMNMGNYYTGVAKPQRLDLAEPFYLKALEYRRKKPDLFRKHGAAVLNSIGRFYVEKKDYANAIKVSQEALRLEKHNKDLDRRAVSYMNLSNSYEDLKNTDSLAKYSILFSHLNDSIRYIQVKGAEKYINQAVSIKAKEKDIEHQSSTKQLLLIISGIVLFIAILVGYLWKRDQKIRHAKYEKIINQLQNKEQQIIKDRSLEETFITQQSLNIHEDTVASILHKLDKFEKSEKFLQKDKTLTALANSFDTNPQYLSEIIKQYKGKSFNSYLNSLRIHHIIRVLYRDPIYREYKIAYLAEYCGFASREVFANAFKKETMITPSYFIAQLKNEEKK